MSLHLSTIFIVYEKCVFFLLYSLNFKNSDLLCIKSYFKIFTCGNI